MDKKQIAGVIFAIALISAITGTISIIINTMDMFLFTPYASGIGQIYTGIFYNSTRLVLLIATIITCGFWLFSPLLAKKSGFICILLFIFAAALLICILFLPLPAHFYYETSEYFSPEKVDLYELQLRQSALAMLLQQAVYFIVLGIAKLVLNHTPKKQLPPVYPYAPPPVYYPMNQ